MDVLKDKWKTRLISFAHEVASWSKDESTKIGAVIVTPEGHPLSWGFNGMPRGIDDSVPERHERPLKYRYMEHAERNAIYQANSSLEGAVLFCTHFCCSDCARGIIQKGIATVVIDGANVSGNGFADRWAAEFAITEEMFNEVGIELIIHTEQ